MIGTTVFGIDIPAGTYAVGDRVQLVHTDGPETVLTGMGAPILKSVQALMTGVNAPVWNVYVQNDRWIDPVGAVTGVLSSATSCDEKSVSTINGHDCPLEQNSGWTVYAECIAGATSTGSNSICAVIDIEYPAVNAVISPDEMVGTPCTITWKASNVPVFATGNLAGATWYTKSVDYFKSGTKYMLESVGMSSAVANNCGFVAFSNAAGMGGLTRIIPISNDISAIQKAIKYASVQLKGSFDVKLKLFGANATTTDIVMLHNYLKKDA